VTHTPEDEIVYTLFVGTAREGRAYQLEHRIPKSLFLFAWQGDKQLAGTRGHRIDIVYGEHTLGMGQRDVQAAIRLAKELNSLHPKPTV